MMRNVGVNLMPGQSEPTHLPLSPGAERVRGRGKPGSRAFGKHKKKIIILERARKGSGV